MTGDLAGQRVIFYAQGPDGTLWFGSQARTLASIVDGTLSDEWLASRLLVPGASGVWRTGSPWKEVRAVQSGWSLYVSAASASTHPLSVLPEPTKGCDEAGDLLENALRRATASRLAKAARPSVDLSGGWDSSTIAMLAHHVSAAPVSAVTLVVPGVDDVNTATAIAGETPDLEHLLWVVPRNAVQYADLSSVPFLDEPAAHVANAGRSLWWLKRIAELGSDIHLSGDGGDSVLTARPSYLADLARISRIRAFWDHVAGWSVLRHQPPHALAVAGLGLRRQTYAQALQAAATRLLATNRKRPAWSDLVSWFGHSKTAQWLTPHARELVATRLRAQAEQHSDHVVPGPFGIGDTASWHALTTFGREHRLYADLAASVGVNHHAPFLDDEVVRACWSAPAWVRTTPRKAKPLLAYAASRFVPMSLEQRHTKGDYSAAAYQGIRSNVRSLHDLFTDSRLAALGLLDEAAVRASVELAAEGVPVGLGALDSLASTELWLRRWDEARRGADRGGWVDVRPR